MTDPTQRGWILNRRETAWYGVLHVIQGAGMILLGKKGPRPVLPYVMRKAQENSRRRYDGKSQ